MVVWSTGGTGNRRDRSASPARPRPRSPFPGDHHRVGSPGVKGGRRHEPLPLQVGDRLMNHCLLRRLLGKRAHPRTPTTSKPNRTSSSSYEPTVLASTTAAPHHPILRPAGKTAQLANRFAATRHLKIAKFANIASTVESDVIYAVVERYGGCSGVRDLKSDEGQHRGIDGGLISDPVIGIDGKIGEGNLNQLPTRRNGSIGATRGFESPPVEGRGTRAPGYRRPAAVAPELDR